MNLDEPAAPKRGVDEETPERPQSAVQKARDWALARPAFVVRRAPNLAWLTRGVMAGGVAAALVIVLVGGLVLASTAGSAGRSGGPNSSLAAAATPTPTQMQAWTNPPDGPYPYPTGDSYAQGQGGSTDTDGALPTLGPVVSIPSVDLSTVVSGKVLASVSCDYSGVTPVPVASGRAYLACYTEILAVDLATNQVVSTYKGINDPIACSMTCTAPWPIVIVLDNSGGFWTSGWHSGKYWTRRYDIATGAFIKQIDGWLMGGGSGVIYVWTDRVLAYGMRTGAQTQYKPVGDASASPRPDPYSYGTSQVRVLCGSLLITSSSSSASDTETILDYEGWAPGQREPGSLMDTAEFGGVCWGLFGDGGSDNRTYGSYHLTRFGPSGMDQRSPELPTPVSIWNGTLWLERAFDASGHVYQRLDPATWQAVGIPWRLPSTCYWLLDISGALWCGSSDTASRMDVPMNGVTRVLPTPTPIATAAPSGSASPSPAPSASPSAMPSPSAEASM
jgi:hypothetical protein